MTDPRQAFLPGGYRWVDPPPCAAPRTAAEIITLMNEQEARLRPYHAAASRVMDALVQRFLAWLWWDDFIKQRTRLLRLPPP